MSQIKLILASRNAGKAREFEHLLEGYFSVQPLDAEIELPAETGVTFAENARLKAEAVFMALGENRAVLADDSGLEVTALEGAPGIYSARYAGQTASDQENVQKLLRMLKGISERKARFVCNLCLLVPETELTPNPSETGRQKQRIIFEVSGTLEGVITEEPRGEQGFGYDPVFCPQHWPQTLAEMTPEQKNKLSHREAAVKALLREVFAHEAWPASLGGNGNGV